jgi:hypothetical protein
MASRLANVCWQSWKRKSEMLAARTAGRQYRSKLCKERPAEEPAGLPERLP